MPSTIHSPLSTEFRSRLVTLCDGRPGLRGGIHVQTRDPDPSTLDPQPSTLDFISSDESLDRYDEILVATGWRLDNYRRNPVFQNAHQYGDIIFTLGRALQTEVRDGRLYQRIEFATDVNPMARIAYGLYQGKFLNAVSVGFIPIRWENGAADAGYRRKYLEQELLEVSAVGIPANPNALALGLKSGAIEKTDLHELLDLLRNLCESPSRRTGFQPVSIDDVHPTAILPLALPNSAARGNPSTAGDEGRRDDNRGPDSTTPPLHHSNTPSLHHPIPLFPAFCSPTAAPNTLARASSVRSNEAQWLQLARDIQRVMRDA